MGTKNGFKDFHGANYFVTQVRAQTLCTFSCYSRRKWQSGAIIFTNCFYSSYSSEFRLCYYPHKLDKFTSMLDAAFGARAAHRVFADFKPLSDVPVPAFYIHVMEKPRD